MGRHRAIDTLEGRVHRVDMVQQVEMAFRVSVQERILIVPRGSSTVRKRGNCSPRPADVVCPKHRVTAQDEDCPVGMHPWGGVVAATQAVGEGLPWSIQGLRDVNG